MIFRYRAQSGHSNAGTEYIILLKEHDMVRSMSRAGKCWDNAVVERFFGSLKRERTYFQNYATRVQAREGLIDYIERFYNEAQLRSFLEYVSPNEFEWASDS